MSRGSPHLQFLRGFTKDELQAIPDRCDWCRVRKTSTSTDELSKYIRESIERNVSNGNITYTEAMADIRRKVLIPGPETVAQKIRNMLRETPVSTLPGENTDGDAATNWYIAQYYGALTASIVRPYTVKTDYPLNIRHRPSADIYVESDQGDGDYLIEIKSVLSVRNTQAVKRQLERYHQAIETELGRMRERTFLCIVGIDLEPSTYGESRKSRPLPEYMDVPSTISEVEDDLERVEVISNSFL